MLTRRDFLATTAAAPLLAAAPAGGPKRIAIVATVWYYLSHAQHMGDRFLVGYPHNGQWHHPNIKVVSLYVDQKPANDQSEQRAREFGFKVYPTIAEALRCGGPKLAVDAVVIIGEHGKYPRNEKGQVLYPRYEFFKQCVEVFDKDGRALPVYNDKHLSYSFAKAKWMVEQSRRLRFPMLAGSSLPVTWRLPDLELPLESEIEDAVMVGVGGSDPMDFHALEALQCFMERRKGGETGVKAVQMITGDAVWKAGDEGRWSKDLLRSAISRSDTPQGHAVLDGRTEDMVGLGEVQRLAKDPAAYFIEYNDGVKATLLMLNGVVADYNVAVRIKGMPPQAVQFLLTPVPNVTYSACLVSKIEEMIMTGRAPYPVERTQLVSGVLEACLTSKLMNQQRLETPNLAVSYRAPVKPQHARA
ncbi:MAG: hypothetical protein IT160_12690 [Bryobacterales bacterium]|nr:hypothetical protein [Bryobacterales bacterium]